MSAWIVYSKDGQTERCKLKKLEYSGSFMNERTVTATFEYHSEVAFEVFDYIVYRGEKFELEAIPSVKKISSVDYQYELRFVSLKYELERCEMRDIVPSDNGITYPTPLTFSFTGDVRYLTERIQANLDALYGQGVWSIVVSDDVESEEKNITIAQQNCWNALSLVNTTYGLNFSIKGRVVTVGGNQPSVGHTFQYGKGNGLYEIERNSDTDTGIVTKLRAYGSTRNLDYSYPKKPEWADSVLPVSFILSPLRLMLPSFKEDGKTDYILADEATISEYGIREASVIYDDIYPSITGATNSSGVPIDEIKSVEPIDDSASTFVVYLHDLEFDLESHLTTDNAQISMKSGAMQGYTFNISEIERISNNFYKITLGRITTAESDTGNYDIPNSSWHMEAGDKFVFLNILMPQKYIRDAEERLLKRAQEYLAEYGKTNFSYNVGLHDKFLKQHEDIYNELIEGSKLSVYDSELGISENVTVQSITITEYADDNILPQVKVTLNNKPSASTLERIQGQIKELSETSAGQFSTQSELLKQYRRKLDKPFFDRLFAAVDFDGNEIPSTDMTTPIAYIKARFNFASLGGVTMYLDDKSLNLPSIYDGLPIDHDTIYWENGVLKAKGSGTGGVDEDAVRTLIESYGYTTEDWVKDYVSENATGGIESITKQMVIEALGFTPYSAANPNGYITAASIPSALKNPYALTFGSKTYDGSSAKEITASDLGAALSSDLSKYLPLTGGTISGQSVNPLTINSTNSDNKCYIPFTVNGVIKAYVGASNGDAFLQESTKNNYISINSDGAFYNTNKIWHEGNFNPANYLPLSGGVLTANNSDRALTLKGNADGSWVGFIGNDDTFFGSIGVQNDKTPYFYDKTAIYKIWHSGNDGSGSGLDADKLDGVHASSLMRLYTSNDNVDDLAGNRIILFNGIVPPYAVGTTQHWGAILQWSSASSQKPSEGSYYFQLWGDTQKEHLWYRVRVNGNAWKATKQIAFITDNVASADTSYGVRDYNSTDSTIKIGYAGSSLSSFTHLAAYGSSGGNTAIKDVGVDSVRSWLELGSLAYKSSLVASDIPSLDWSKITSGKPTTISGYGITDAITTSNIGSQSVNYATSSGSCTGNAASATKLSDNTSFTIWGQEFFVNGKPKSVNGAFRLLREIPGTVVIHKALVYPTSPYGLITRAYIDGDISLQVQREDNDSECFNLLLNPLGGNVGIGTASPAYKLDVIGNIKCDGLYVTRIGGAAVYVFDGIDNTNDLRIEASGGNSNIRFYTNNQGGAAEKMVLSYKGYLGIGTASPSAKLHVVGNILATGGVTMQSARILKNVVDERGLSLTELSAIKPTRYTWKDKRDDRLHFGGIADDIEKVLPEVIYKTADGTLTMDYGNAGFAIASSLIKPVVDHETKIRMLEIRVKELEEELKRYSA